MYECIWKLNWFCFSNQLMYGINLNECVFQWIVNRTSEYFHANQTTINASKTKWNFWISFLHICHVPCLWCNEIFIISNHLVLDPNEIVQKKRKKKCEKEKREILSAQHTIIYYYNIVDENCYDKDTYFM